MWIFNPSWAVLIATNVALPIVGAFAGANLPPRQSSRTRLNSKNENGKKQTVAEKPDDLHWICPQDEFRIQPHGLHCLVDDDDGNPTDIPPLKQGRLTFKIRGNPLPLRRHRTARGFVYNPSQKAQNSFRKVFQDLVFPDDELFTAPFFPEDQPLFVSIVFAMKRPNNHFTSSKRGAGRLKAKAPPITSPTRQDVDNLAKFVLDSLNECAYADDRQVISLHVTKILDSDGECWGSTAVDIRPIDADQVTTIVENSLGLF